MNRRTLRAVLLPVLLQAGLGFGAADGAQPLASAEELTVPSGTQLRVEVTQRCRLRKDKPLQGRLLEPIYADNRLLIPAGAVLQGKIVELMPAPHNKRIDAKLHGDFTPLREPVIEWTTVTRADGEKFRLDGETTNGAGGTLFFRSKPAPHVSALHRMWNSFAGSKDATVEQLKAPNKGQRLQRYFWSQMPLHPQYLEEGTQYEMTLTEPLQLPAGPAPAVVNVSEQQALPDDVWVHSRLLGDLNSATAKPGDLVDAVVTQPVVNAQNQLILPQNSILRGRIISANPSGKWAHNGALRFTFNQVILPSGFQHEVEGTPMALESNLANRIAVDQEGGVSQPAEHKILAPLAMGLISAAAMGDDDGASAVKAGAASNGFAIVGRVAGLASGSPFVGGTIGAVATGRTVYEHWLGHGKEMHFGPDTEVVVEMAPAHGTRLTSAK